MVPAALVNPRQMFAKCKSPGRAGSRPGLPGRFVAADLSVNSIYLKACQQ